MADAKGPRKKAKRRRSTRQWLTTPEMAVLLDMHPKTLLAYARERRVPEQFLLRTKGGRYRWRADFAAKPVFLDVPIAA